MREVIYSLMVSLDGYIESPQKSLDWVIVDEELHTYFNDQESNIDTHLYGRRMYEVMVAGWPTADQDPSAPQYIIDFARTWRAMPKVVFSTTLERVEWNARLVRENVAEEVKRLKAQPGKNMGLGGAGIAKTLMEHDLIDEYRLILQPVVLGGGTPMFPALDSPLNLRLVETRAFASGVVLLRYRR